MKINELPFTQTRTDGTIDAWCPEATGNYESDWKAGELIYADLIGRSPTTVQLTHVLSAIVEKGKVTGVELGFLSALSNSAVSI
jgi:hypothetical protein